MQFPFSSEKMKENNKFLVRGIVLEKGLVSLAFASYTAQRRRGRVVEGTPLLRVQAGNRLEGSNPFVSAIISLKSRRSMKALALWSRAAACHVVESVAERREQHEKGARRSLNQPWRL